MNSRLLDISIFCWSLPHTYQLSVFSRVVVSWWRRSGGSCYRLVSQKTQLLGTDVLLGGDLNDRGFDPVQGGCDVIGAGVGGADVRMEL